MSARVIIVDDEPLARLKVRDLLADHEDIEIVGEAGDGSEAVRLVRELRPDLVFLDVQIPGPTGIEVARDIGAGPGAKIIFVTAYDQYAIQAFELHACDYLLKPLDRDRFCEALDRFRQDLRRPSPADGFANRLEAAVRELKASPSFPLRIAIPARDRIYFIAAAEVERAEAAGNYVVFHTPPCEHLVRTGLNDVERMLDPRMFLRIHRSAIVNVDRIEEVRRTLRGGYVLMMRSGAKIAASRSYGAAVKRLLGGKA